MPRSSTHSEGCRCGRFCRIALLFLSGLTLSALPSLAIFAQETPPGTPAPHDPFAPHIAEARGTRESAYQGRYEVRGNYIYYWDDTGFTADGEFIDDVLHHAGMVLYRQGHASQQ